MTPGMLLKSELEEKIETEIRDDFDFEAVKTLNAA